MAEIPDTVVVKICDEDRERIDQLGKSIGWLREHIEEIRAFAQIPAIPSPSDPVVPDESFPGWQRFIIQQIEKPGTIAWSTENLPPNTTFTVKVDGKDHSTVCMKCGKPLLECKCSSFIGAVVEQPGD